MGSPGGYDWQFKIILQYPTSLRRGILFMQNRYLICIFVVAVCLVTACRFNPDMQSPGQTALQGEWLQDATALQKKLVNYSLYQLKFSCDSFYVSIQSFSKANGGNADSCVKNGRWEEFAKGSYNQKNDTLHLQGLFCNADFSYKIEGGCFRSGKYDEYFRVRKKSDSILQFYSTSSVIPFDTHLVKRTTCNPKPL